jgi:hypothetical protein
MSFGVRIGKGGDFPAVSALASRQTFAKSTGKYERCHIGLTRGSKQSRYSDVIGVLCFDCDEKALQPSALLLTSSIQTSFSAKL